MKLSTGTFQRHIAYVPRQRGEPALVIIMTRKLESLTESPTLLLPDGFPYGALALIPIFWRIPHFPGDKHPPAIPKISSESHSFGDVALYGAA